MNQLRALAMLVFLSFSLPLASAFAASPAADLTNHPLYSTYQFGGQDSKVIDLGTHPMTAPVGVLGAALGHDRLLRAALKERGWELRSHSFLKGPDCNFFFQHGDIEVALAGDWPTVTLAATTDLQVVGLAKQGFTAIITKGQHRMEDFKGLRFGSALGTTAHYGLLVGLENAGIKESEVTIVPLEVTEMIEALAQGKIDAFAAWEPTPTNALRTHPEFSLVQRFMNNSYVSLSADLTKKNPEVAELVVASYVRALRWMRDDRKNLMRAIDWALHDSSLMEGKPTTLSREDMAETTTDDLLKIAASPMVPKQDLTENGSLRRAFTFLQQQGKIAATVPWSKIETSFDYTLIERILTAPEKYQLLAVDYDN